GISFELLYSPTAYLDPQTTEAGSFLGNDVIFFPNIDKNSGKISIGISQKAPQSGVSGSGVVARIKMVMSASAPAGQTVTITLQNIVANDSAGAAIAITPMGACTTTGVQEFTQTGSVPTAFALLPNTPNPFNPSTLIKYELPQQVEVKLVIFDLMGRRVRTLVDQRQQSGRYAITWDGRNEQGEVVTSGVYIYQLRAGNFVQTRRMALVR
ncbi:MAG: T9SS type A sorting domain-containing protein, partial [candidate division KSB1 bacterium]|nr:T9SS type A sorting domain-containing protein [candidate division KSB1 bacterium]